MQYSSKEAPIKVRVHKLCKIINPNTCKDGTTITIRLGHIGLTFTLHLQ
jgi:hypothetical protein